MRIGKLISIPNEYSNYGRVLDGAGFAYTVEAGDIPEGAQVGSDLAYRVELWGNESGVAYDLREEED